MNRTICILLLLVAMAMYACGPEKPVKGFYGRKFGNYEPGIRPKVLRTYPKQINAIVETELEEIYGRPVAHDITVSFCVVTEEKDGKPHSYLDTTEYSTHVLVTGDIEASWLFDISRPGLRLTRKMKLED